MICFSNAFSQGGIAYYNLYIQKSVDDNISYKQIKGLKYQLKFNSKSYEFILVNRMNSDFNKRDFIHAIRTNSGSLIYKNYNSNEKLLEHEIGNEIYYIDIKNYQCNWELSKNTERISGFNSKLAYCSIEKSEKKIEAWYSSDISIPAGPAGYDSLPGLITKLVLYDRYVFILEKINFSDEEINIDAPQGQIITEAEANQIFKSKTGIDVNEKLKELNDKRKNN